MSLLEVLVAAWAIFGLFFLPINHLFNFGPLFLAVGALLSIVAPLIVFVAGFVFYYGHGDESKGDESKRSGGGDRPLA